MTTDLFDLVKHQINTSNKIPREKRFHIALYFLKNYQSECNDAVLFRACEKTIRQIRFDVVKEIAAQKLVSIVGVNTRSRCTLDSPFGSLLATTYIGLVSYSVRISVMFIQVL